METELTYKERQTILLNAAKSAKEIANTLESSVFTTRKHIDNVKKKAELQINTEMVTFFFAKAFEVEFDELKEKIIECALSTADFSDIRRWLISKALLVIVLFTIVPTNNDDYLRAQRSSQARTARTVRSGKRAREGEAIELEGLINEA